MHCTSMLIVNNSIRMNCTTVLIVSNLFLALRNNAYHKQFNSNALHNYAFHK